MKNETEIVRYPIAKNSTTVKNIFQQLNLLDSSGLKSAISRGRITLDGSSVASPRDRVSPGQSLTYGELEIQVYLDEQSKGKRLTQLAFTGGMSYGQTCGKAGGLGGFQTGK